jgi:hypothetical protein
MKPPSELSKICARRPGSIEVSQFDGARSMRGMPPRCRIAAHKSGDMGQVRDEVGYWRLSDIARFGTTIDTT